MLAAVCCHFNPCGYRRPVQNYFRFREAFRGCPLFTIEASFHGAGDLPADWHIRATGANAMWQKERLLNLAIARLPDEFDQVAWIDADFVFLNPHWAAQTEVLLCELPVVQLFEHVHYVDAGGCIDRSIRSLLHHRRENGALSGAPGGAWAARRDLIAKHGLYDADVLGGGDCRWAEACLGYTGNLSSRSTEAQNVHARAWAEKVFPDVGGRVGLVPGDVLHLFHGTTANRRYVERSAILREGEFDPATDVAPGKSGLLEWRSRKPHLQRQVAEYFLGRKEDG